MFIDFDNYFFWFHLLGQCIQKTLVCVSVSTQMHNLPLLEMGGPFTELVPLPDVRNPISGTAFTVCFFAFWLGRMFSHEQREREHEWSECNVGRRWLPSCVPEKAWSYTKRGMSTRGQCQGKWHRPTKQCCQLGSEMLPYVESQQVNHHIIIPVRCVCKYPNAQFTSTGNGRPISSNGTSTGSEKSHLRYCFDCSFFCFLARAPLQSQKSLVNGLVSALPPDC